MLYPTRTEYLAVPLRLQDDPALYFSRKSQCIVLDGPKGWLLAHYFGMEPPDAKQLRFLTNYQDDYIPFKGAKVPDDRKSNIRGYAWPVPALADHRSPVFSGAIGSMDNQTDHSPYRVQLAPTAPFTDPLEQPGLRLEPGAMEAYFDGGGLGISRDGVRFEGVLTLNATMNRGITGEGPLATVVPKTAVTFFVADYLPAVQKLQEYVIWIARIVRVTDAVYNIARLLLDRIGSEAINRRLDAFERGAENIANRTGL